ncbi:MAG: hypothetical protein FWD16_05590 [Clostridia bacterium]|nr:hypothetical protein [Clostridia bacterium]
MKKNIALVLPAILLLIMLAACSLSNSPTNMPAQTSAVSVTAEAQHDFSKLELFKPLDDYDVYKIDIDEAACPVFLSGTDLYYALASQPDGEEEYADMYYHRLSLDSAKSVPIGIVKNGMISSDTYAMTENQLVGEWFVFEDDLFSANIYMFGENGAIKIHELTDGTPFAFINAIDGERFLGRIGTFRDSITKFSYHIFNKGVIGPEIVKTEFNEETFDGENIIMATDHGRIFGYLKETVGGNATKKYLVQYDTQGNLIEKIEMPLIDEFERTVEPNGQLEYIAKMQVIGDYYTFTTFSGFTMVLHRNGDQFARLETIPSNGIIFARKCDAGGGSSRVHFVNYRENKLYAIDPATSKAVAIADDILEFKDAIMDGSGNIAATDTLGALYYLNRFGR